MAQQVFNQWVPVAKAQNEQGQEVYLPFAGIHAQTRDGRDEIIVGAGNMVWTGSMWVPVSAQNRLPVDAAVSGTVDVSDRADRQLGKVELSDSVTPGQRYEIETIHDAVTLAPGEMTPAVTIPVKDANILFLAINVNATGWSLVYDHSAPFGGGTATVSVFGYPSYVDANVIAQFSAFPILVLPLLTLETFRQQNRPPETWEEALLFRSVQSTRPRIRNDRESGNITVTIRALRLWR